MKKVIAILLCLLLIASLAGCGSKPETPAEPEKAPAPSPAPEPESEKVTGGVFSPDGSVIFEKDGLKVTTAGMDYADGLPIILTDIENSGDEDAYLGVAHGAVNGFMTETYLIGFKDFDEDDEYYGYDYSYDQTIPAGETVRCALGYNDFGADIDLSTLAEMAFYFTLAEDDTSWPDYTSELVTIKTGEEVPEVDIANLGTVVIDNDEMLLVLGDQDYDHYYGPTVNVYMENKTDGFLGISAETAEADGVACDYIFGTTYAGPHMRCAGFMSFDGEMSEMKGFEDFSVVYTLYEADTYDGLNDVDEVTLDPVSVKYPPQIWGEYENGGLTMEIKPRCNDLVTVETPKNDADGILFTVSETASLEAGGYEGAGWLYSIGRLSEDELHEKLCYDMSGAEVFAKDDEGNYYMYYHPTDVRYDRATVEEMQRDAGQWTMLCEWADSMKDRICEANELEYESFGNSELDMLVARAAWMKDAKATITFLEPYGTVELSGVDGTPYADFILHSYFQEDWEGVLEVPDGEYMVMNLPEEDARIDFFFGDPSMARVTMNGDERLYQAGWYDNSISCAEAVHGWYYAAAEKAGLKEADNFFDDFLGDWHEKIAGRGTLSIEKSVAPDKVKIYARWPASASEAAEWNLIGTIEEGELYYDNGEYEVIEYSENGESWTNDWSEEESGHFYLNGSGELCWHNDSLEGEEDSVFVR